MLAVLWAADAPLVPAQVQEALGGQLAYNTVLTILSRLHDKGAVARTRTGRAHAYRPVLDEVGLAAQRMRALLDRGGNRAAVLRRFVHDLDEGDDMVLAEALREASRAEDAGG